jgi:low affinity Fe/Cu permease
MAGWFSRLASRASNAAGHYWAFCLALGIVIVWALTGPLFGFTDTWQLVINTGTTIVTFLMVFLIQNSQNRDSRAMHLKLDELIRAVENASNSLIDAEEDDEEQLNELQKIYAQISGEHEQAKADAIVDEVEAIKLQKARQTGAVRKQSR